VVLIGFSYIVESTNAGLSRLAPWVLEVLIQPAIMIRRWFAEIPGAELSYHYYGVIGVFDYISLIIFYVIVCIILAWCWVIIRSKISRVEKSLA